MAQATLYNPTTRARRAVTVGSPEAQQLFGQGYFLETNYNPQTRVSTYDQPATRPVEQVRPAQAVTNQTPNLQNQASPSIIQAPTSPNMATPELSSTRVDLSPFQRQISALRGEFSNVLQPSGEEKTLQQKLVDIQTNLNQKRGLIEQKEIGLKQGIAGLESKAIETGSVPLQLLRGQQAKLQEQGLLQLQSEESGLRTLQGEEANLINRLGLAKDARTAQKEGLITKLNFLSEDINLQLKLQDRLLGQEQNALKQKQTLQAEQRKTLDSILEAAKGKTLQELTPETQTQILQLAKTSNLPIDVLANQLQVAKDKATYEKVKQENELTKQKAEIAKINRTSQPKSTPMPESPIAEIPDYNTFLVSLGNELQMTINPDSQQAKDAYEAFKLEANQGTSVDYSLAELQKLLTITDKQKMIAAGLDINSQDDILNYLKGKQEKTETGKTTTDDEYDSL